MNSFSNYFSPNIIFSQGTGSHFIILWTYDVSNEWILTNTITTGETVFPIIKQIIFVESEKVLLLLDQKVRHIVTSAI